MTQISLVLVGDARIALPLSFDGAGADGVGVRHAENCQAAEDILADPLQAVDLLVLSEPRPGQFSAAAIEALRRRAPLVRVWRLLGSWCEGETRSGRPPSGCPATYWHQWEARWAQERDRAALGHCPAWSLPLTSSSEERAVAAASYPLERARGPIGIYASRAETALALADACRLGGYSPVIVGRSHASLSKEREERLETGDSRPEAGQKNGQVQLQSPPPNPEPLAPVIWDTSADEMTNPAAVERLRAIAGRGAIVAIVGFPRADDCRRAAEAGIAAVVSKPYSVRDLLWHVARVMQRVSA